MEDFNFDKHGNSSDQPIKELVEREEYEKCAVLLEAAKSYRQNKKELKKLKKTKE